MTKKIYYIFLSLLSVSLFFSACSRGNEVPLKSPEPLVCPKVEPLSLEEKDLSINIDKIVMIMPEEEKKVKKKKVYKKKKVTKKIPKVKKEVSPKVEKTVVVAPKKLIKKKELAKSIGDKVCREGKKHSSYMSLDLVGKVTQKKLDKLQIKIMDSYSKDKPEYNGIGLYKNTVIWDKSSYWKICK